MTREYLGGVALRDPEFVGRCTARVTAKDGGRKYHDAASDRMLFETMPIDDLFRFTEEEVLDVPNYAAMLAARDPRLDPSTLVELAHAMWVELGKLWVEETARLRERETRERGHAPHRQASEAEETATRRAFGLPS
jgi:hypothetical protein